MINNIRVEENAIYNGKSLSSGCKEELKSIRKSNGLDQGWRYFFLVTIY